MSTAQEPERRRAQRKTMAKGVARVKVLPGREAAVLNLSEYGALVEGDFRLLPGALMNVHLISPTASTQVRALVARCTVSALPRGRSAQYRAALSFDHGVPLVRE